MKNNDFGAHKSNKSWLLAASALAVLTAGVSVRTNVNADTTGGGNLVLTSSTPTTPTPVDSTNGAVVAPAVSTGTAAAPTDSLAAAQTAVTTASSAVSAAQTVVTSTQNSLDSLTTAQTSAQKASSDASNALTAANNSAAQASLAVSSAASALNSALSSNSAVSSASAALSEATSAASLASTAVSAAQDSASAAGSALVIASSNAISTVLVYGAASTAVSNFIDQNTKKGVFDPSALNKNQLSNYTSLVTIASNASDSASSAAAVYSSADSYKNSVLTTLDSAKSNFNLATSAVSVDTSNLADTVATVAPTLPEETVYQTAKNDLVNAQAAVASATDVSSKASDILNAINTQIAAIQAALDTANANLVTAQSDLTVAESTLAAAQAAAGQTSTQVTTSLPQATVPAPKETFSAKLLDDDNNLSLDYTPNGQQTPGSFDVSIQVDKDGTYFIVPPIDNRLVSGQGIYGHNYTLEKSSDGESSITYNGVPVWEGERVPYNPTGGNSSGLIYHFENSPVGPQNNIDQNNTTATVDGQSIIVTGKVDSLNGNGFDYEVYISIEDSKGNYVGSYEFSQSSQGPNQLIIASDTWKGGYTFDNLNNGDYWVEISVYKEDGPHEGHKLLDEYELKKVHVGETPPPPEPGPTPTPVPPTPNPPRPPKPPVTTPPDGTAPAPGQNQPGSNQPGQNQPGQNPNEPWVNLPLDYPPKGQPGGQEQLPKTGEASDHSMMIGAAMLVMGAAGALMAYAGNSEKRRKMLLSLAADDRDD